MKILKCRDHVPNVQVLKLSIGFGIGSDLEKSGQGSLVNKAIFHLVLCSPCAIMTVFIHTWDRIIQGTGGNNVNDIFHSRSYKTNVIIM